MSQRTRATEGVKPRSTVQTEQAKNHIFGDKVLWIILTVMFIISILVVYSSTAKMAYDINAIKSTQSFLASQLIVLAISISVAYFVSQLKNITYYRVTPFLFALSLILTLWVYFTGNSTNGAARWISIFGFQFQPSEMLKVTTVMYVARALALRQDVISKLKIIPTFKFWKWLEPKELEVIRTGFAPILAPVLAACIVVAPAHTSSALIIFIVSYIIMLVGRVRWVELGKILLVVGAFCAIYTFFGAGRSVTASSRVETWQETLFTDRSGVPVDELTDTERSMVAIRVGGLAGQGAGKSAMRVEIMHPESDYAYAFFVEEYGLALGFLVLLFYLWIFSRAISIYRSGCPPFSGLLVLGLALLIVTQAMLHIMVTINLAPETGQPLPIISRGGSSVLFTSFAIGMIIGVSRQRAEIAKEKAAI